MVHEIMCFTAPTYLQQSCNESGPSTPTHVTDYHGLIYSNAGPKAYYEPNMDCGIVINTKSGKPVGLTFTWIDLPEECTASGDYIRVHDGSSQFAPVLVKFLCKSPDGWDK